MKKVKLLVLTTTFPRWKGDGGPARMYRLYNQIAEDQNILIYILSPHDNNALKEENMGRLHIVRFPYFFPIKYQKLAHNGGILPNLRTGILPKIQIPLLFFAELFYTLKMTKKENFNIIHSNWMLPSGLIGAFMHKLCKIRHVMTIHAAGLVVLEKLPGNRTIANFIFKNSDHITVIGSYYKERLRNMISPKFSKEVNKKVTNLPLGVDISAFQNKINREIIRKKYNLEKKYIILSFGRLAEKKGIAYLLNAMPNILKEHKNTILVICGRGPEKKKLENLAMKLNLRDNVKFVGYVDENVKADYFALSDILVVPSIITQGGDTEGVPSVILEGMAAGLPVIASDVGGISDAIIDQKTGLLIQPKSPEAIVKAVISLIKNKKLCNQLATIGKRSVYEKFSLKIIGNQYRNLLITNKI